MKQQAKKVAENVKESNERGARRTVIEDLFFDFNRSRTQVYRMNFIRGIFFGLGSVLGGTIVVAILLWILSAVGGVFPPLHDFFNGVTNTIESQPR